MNNPKFYIYGVPDGFNMLSGTPDEILYFQLFYDTSRRGRELRINRKANGETVYSYLIYNLVSCKGREGAFLGMSIVFSGSEYCNNPVALKELFEGVYNEVILKADDKDKIIAAIDGGSAVGRFCIPKFEERQEMCEKIGRIIVNNVVNELGNLTRVIDKTFDNSKEGRILTLPLQADNTSINQALKKYTWVSLSSECKSIPELKDPPPDPIVAPGVVSQDLLSVHFINELAKKVGPYKDFIIQGLKGLVSHPEVTSKREEINHYLDTIEEYVGRQPELTKLKGDYMSIYKELVDLKPQKKVDPLQPEGQPNPPVNDDKDGIMELIRHHLTKIIAALCVVLVVAVIIVLWPSDEKKPSKMPDDNVEEVEEVAEGVPSDIDDASKGFDANRFNALLAGADYKAAWSMLQKVDNAKKKENLEQALQNSYRVWFNSELKKRQNDLQGLLELKQKIAAYADFNNDNDMHNKFLDDYITPLQEQIAKSEREHQERLAQQERERRERSAPEREQSGSENSGGGEATGTSSHGGVIKIFKADVNYKKEAPVVGNKITCQKGDCFIVEGNFDSYVTKGNIEINRQKDTMRIKASNLGSHKVILNQNHNQIIFVFNVNPPKEKK